MYLFSGRDKTEPGCAVREPYQSASLTRVDLKTTKNLKQKRSTARIQPITADKRAAVQVDYDRGNIITLDPERNKAVCGFARLLIRLAVRYPRVCGYHRCFVGVRLSFVFYELRYRNEIEL